MKGEAVSVKWYHKLSLIALLGIGLVLFGAFVLETRTPNVVQYAFAGYGEPEAMMDQLGEIREALSDTTDLITLHGVLGPQTVSVPEGQAGVDAQVFMAGPGYFSLYPQPVATGEIISPMDLQRHASVIMLDDDMSFQLFGERGALGQEVMLGGKRYTVVGTVRYSAGYGTLSEHAVWLPLGADEALLPDMMVLSVYGGADNGLMTLLETSASQTFGPGTLVSAQKEKMRAYMPIYLIGLVAAVYALMKLYGFVKGQIVYLVGRIGEKLRYVYPRQAFFYIVGHILLCALAVGVLVGAFYLAMSVFLRPVSVFVEWVPEVLVSWQSISARFWELVRAQAQPIRYTTGEYAAVAFGAFLIRWGTMLFLIGLGLKSITLKQKGQGR